MIVVYFDLCVLLFEEFDFIVEWLVYDIVGVVYVLCVLKWIFIEGLLFGWGMYVVV